MTVNDDTNVTVKKEKRQTKESENSQQIVDSKFDKRSRKVFYKVKWVGNLSSTWEPLANLLESMDAIVAFHRNFPKKPAAL